MAMIKIEEDYQLLPLRDNPWESHAEKASLSPPLNLRRSSGEAVSAVLRWAEAPLQRSHCSWWSGEVTVNSYLTQLAQELVNDFIDGSGNS